MSRCEGLHCPGCGEGGSKAGIIGGGVVATILAAEWVASHLWELLAVTAVCGALAVSAVVALVRWGDRREVRHAIEHPFLAAREVPAAVTSAARPALGFRDLHIHLDGLPADEQARIIRTAIERKDSNA